MSKKTTIFDLIQKYGEDLFLNGLFSHKDNFYNYGAPWPIYRILISETEPYSIFIFVKDDNPDNPYVFNLENLAYIKNNTINIVIDIQEDKPRIYQIKIDLKHLRKNKLKEL